MEGRLPRGFCIKRLTDLPMLWSEHCRTAGISEDVTLQLKAASSFKRQARIAWRRIEHCGVKFTEPELDVKAEQPHAAGHQMAPDRSDLRS